MKTEGATRGERRVRIFEIVLSMGRGVGITLFRRW
jgi:hypothetical protein